jgi:hypothetical protein
MDLTESTPSANCRLCRIAHIAVLRVSEGDTRLAADAARPEGEALAAAPATQTNFRNFIRHLILTWRFKLKAREEPRWPPTSRIWKRLAADPFFQAWEASHQRAHQTNEFI